MRRASNEIDHERAGTQLAGIPHAEPLSMGGTTIVGMQVRYEAYELWLDKVPRRNTHKCTSLPGLLDVFGGR